MNIVVTGSNGQLGKELQRYATEQTNQYTFIDIDELDLTDAVAVSTFFEKHPTDVIVNCAAYTAVDQAERMPELAERINHHAVRYLAQTAHRLGALLIHISTDYVFEGTAHLPYRESDPTHPLGVYGATKLRGEQAISQSGCRHLILRTAWLYSSFGQNFFKTILRLADERERLSVVVDQIGTPTYARDLAGFIADLISQEKLESQGTYHFTNSGVASWYDFATAIVELSGKACTVSPCLSHEYPTPARRPHYSILEKSQLTATFGIVPRHWREALQACLADMAL